MIKIFDIVFFSLVFSVIVIAIGLYLKNSVEKFIHKSRVENYFHDNSLKMVIDDDNCEQKKETFTNNKNNNNNNNKNQNQNNNKKNNDDNKNNKIENENNKYKTIASNYAEFSSYRRPDFLGARLLPHHNKDLYPDFEKYVEGNVYPQNFYI